MFLHRGIAARQFQRAFVLAEGIEVRGAWLDNGLLHIDLARPQPETRVKTIQIRKAHQRRRGGGGGQAGRADVRTTGRAIGGPNQTAASALHSRGRRSRQENYQ